MAPGADHQKGAIVSRVPRLSGRVAGDGAIDVFLIPLSMHVEGGDREWACRENPINRLLLPVAVVGRVLRQPLPERQLVRAGAPTHLAGRAGFQESIVVIKLPTPKHLI